MIKGLRLFGTFGGPSGYDRHVREFSRAFAGLGVPIGLQDFPDWGAAKLPYHLRDPWFESLPPSVDADAMVHFCFPDQVEPEPAMLNVNYTMFEATRIPAGWAAAHGLSDFVAVPTEHSRQAWVRSGVPASKVGLSPLGVRTDLYRPGVRPMDLKDAAGKPLASYGVRFLNVSALDGRKNLPGLLRAWLRATSPSDDAVLIMKTGAYTPGSLFDFEYGMSVVQKQAGKTFAEAAPVHFIRDLLPDADMPRLFAAATHYVSLSLGEGWDLPMIEAAASGLRLIAPRHSAYLDYLDDDIATMLPARESKVVNASGESVSKYFEGSSWWVPDEEAAIVALRRAIEGGDEARASARERVAHLTWANAATSLLEVIEEALAKRRR